jgi:hypothetical protein
MRAVNITGKHNIDKMNELGNESYQAIRKTMTHVDEELLLHTTQMDLLREIDIDDRENIIKSLLKSEITLKIQGYKGQDLKKNIHIADTLITYTDVREKLLATNMTCIYCSQPVLVLYKNVREPTQWTLDRIDNNLSHTRDNTCIACLKCNLQRRVIHLDKFMFTKKLKINKI